jgi:aminoglycoside phosphotransferase (APT) family kinase protein
MELVVRHVVQQQLGVEVETVEPLFGNGSVNSIFVVRSATGVFVVRLNDRNSLPQFRKEVWCLDQAKLVGVPGPEVRAVGEVEEHAYMLQGFVSGEHGADAANPARLWHTVGGYARRIHTIPVAGWGEVMTAPGSFKGSWEKHLDYNIETLTPSDELRRRGLIDAPLSDALRDRFLWLRERELRFGLCHGDLALRNVVVDGALVTLLDWGSAEAHVVPHFDLLEVLKSSFQLQANDPGFKSFVSGYGIADSQFAAIKDELDALLMLRAVDKLRWALDRSPSRVDHFTQYLAEVVTHVKPMIG